MKVLIACECSCVVRDEFIKIGHDAWSCDIQFPRRPGNHIKDDVLKHLNESWDLMIAHPPCDHLAVSGARWFSMKQTDGQQQAAIDFFMEMINAPIERIAVENPIGIMSTVYRKPDQIIQPWMFGHEETKKTCLWLKNLPLLKPTKVVLGRKHSVHHEPLGSNRQYNRSKTFPGIAKAMAEQWG
ncbi:MAG: hypothetical protein WAV05_08765 [Anaerolineales bacterium]